jgi:hypothetical protein
MAKPATQRRFPSQDPSRAERGSPAPILGRWRNWSLMAPSPLTSGSGDRCLAQVIDAEGLPSNPGSTN